MIRFDVQNRDDIDRRRDCFVSILTDARRSLQLTANSEEYQVVCAEKAKEYQANHGGEQAIEGGTSPSNVECGPLKPLRKALRRKLQGVREGLIPGLDKEEST